MPASRIALAVPPVERRWTFLEWRNCARGRREDLSETERRARVMGTMSVAVPRERRVVRGSVRNSERRK